LEKSEDRNFSKSIYGKKDRKISINMNDYDLWQFEEHPSSSSI
jgi:hypothetical protein